MLTENLEERLKWLDVNKYKHIQAETIFSLEEEKKKPENYAKIAIEVKTGMILYIKGEDVCLECLHERTVADAIIFYLSETETHLHIIECKTTVRSDEWEHIKKQFKGALLNAFALHGLLALKKITAIYVYTAFRRDKIQPQNNPNPVLLKTGVGTNLNLTNSLDWFDETIKLLSIPNIPHQKIELDENGCANTSIIF
ncbi:hypothetical protein BegalDRAFT_0876 [Beggiatoa alba B18LD]|uniref:Uncharacterized protein n=1 Tax=Beggiatoa alba B18LD TaxID=395493 RepID=I3CDU1_9GAMM|nr:hypothetical protein [Beggiatoa alba]EIJ41784.1 hypothetical protein BegalDRAFT_0876 [Beggiatoa alba B18LD]